MGYLATSEIFESMLLSYRNNDISYRDTRGFGSMLPEKILK